MRVKKKVKTTFIYDGIYCGELDKTGNLHNCRLTRCRFHDYYNGNRFICRFYKCILKSNCMEIGGHIMVRDIRCRQCLSEIGIEESLFNKLFNVMFRR